MRRPWAKVFGWLFAALVWAPLLPAQEPSPAALRGLEGVGIVVQLEDSKLTRDGVTESALQAVVREELEKAAIPVLNTPEGLPEKAPLLETIVGAVRDPSGAFYIIDLSVKLRRASLVRRESASKAEREGWQQSWSGMVPLERMDNVHRQLRSLVREFAKAYLAVNPPPGKAANDN